MDIIPRKKWNQNFPWICASTQYVLHAVSEELCWQKTKKQKQKQNRTDDLLTDGSKISYPSQLVAWDNKTKITNVFVSYTKDSFFLDGEQYLSLMHINYTKRTLGNLWQIIVHHNELNSEHSNIFYVVSTLYLNRSVKPPPLWMTHYGHNGVQWSSPRENSRHFVCCSDRPVSPCKAHSVVKGNVISSFLHLSVKF